MEIMHNSKQDSIMIVQFSANWKFCYLGNEASLTKPSNVLQLPLWWNFQSTSDKYLWFFYLLWRNQSTCSVDSHHVSQIWKYATQPSAPLRFTPTKSRENAKNLNHQMKIHKFVDKKNKDREKCSDLK